MTWLRLPMTCPTCLMSNSQSQMVEDMIRRRTRSDSGDSDDSKSSLARLILNEEHLREIDPKKSIKVFYGRKDKSRVEESRVPGSPRAIEESRVPGDAELRGSARFNSVE